MKTKYLISAVATIMLLIGNINAQVDIGNCKYRWYIYRDSVYAYSFLNDGFDMEYPVENAYISDIPMQTFVNERGATVVTVPLELPDIGSGLKPDLALSYNSMQYETIFGNDWGLLGLSEIRRVSKNIYYNGVMQFVDEDKDIDGTEAFTLNGNRLVILENNFPASVSYQSETGNIKLKAHITQKQENNVSKYIYSYFEVFYPDGKTAIFGFENLEQNKSRILFPIVKISDRLGNKINYSYIFNRNEYKISKISFGKTQLASLEFFYKKAEIPFLKKSDIRYVREIYFYMCDTWIPITFKKQSDDLPLYETLNTNCILSHITSKLDNQIIKTYKFGYHSDNKRIYMSSIQQTIFKDATAVSTNNRDSIINVGIDTIPIYSLPNDSLEFSPPLRFRYGENYTPAAVVKNKNSLKFNNTKRVFKNGTFSSMQTAGLVIYPKVDTFEEIICPANDSILIKPDIDKSITCKLVAGSGFLDIFCIDIDGIAGDEIVKINNSYEELEPVYDENGFALGLTGGFADVLTFEVYTFNASGELIHLYTRQFPTGFELYGNQLINKQFFAGDFNGDGRNEIFTVSALKLKSTDTVKPRGEIYDLENKQIIYEGFMFDNINIPMPVADPSGAVPVTGPYGCLITGDFNGNGISDLLYNPKGTNSGALLEFEFNNSSLKLKKLSDFGKFPVSRHGGLHEDYVTADFNGDERTDMYSESILLSEGKSLSYKHLELPDLYDYVCTEDMDNDGKSDLIYISDKKMAICFFVDSASVAVESVMMGIPKDYRPVSGKNAYNELVFLNGDSILRLSYGIDLSKSILLTGIKSGLGTVTNIEYNKLDSAGFYTQTKDMLFPYQNLSHNTAVVSKIRTHYKNEPLDVKTYMYENGVSHKQGLGFCGFEKVTVLDSIRNQSVIKTFDLLNYGIMKQLESPAAKVVNTYNVNIADNKIAKITLASVAQTDKLKNVTINKSYVYDTYGNVTKETVDFGDGIKQVTDNSYKNFNTGTLYRIGELASTGITNYIPAYAENHGGFADVGVVIGIPINPTPAFAPGIAKAPGTAIPVTTTLTQSISAKTDILYNDKGLPISKTSYYNSKKVSEETSAYSNFGDLLSLSTKPYNETSVLKKTFEYDSYGRVTKETDPANNSIEYHYNNDGLLNQTKDIYGNITNYGYDNFRRLITTTSPLGSVASVKYRWVNAGTGPAAAIYAVTNNAKTGTDQMVVPETTVYYDALGREIRSEQMRFDGSLIKTDKFYDKRGRLWKVSLPFKGSAPTLWNVYSYDDFDRPASILYASGKQDTWTYSGNSITSKIDGITSTKTYNAAGQLTKVTDAGGTISYQYRPDGQAEKIVTNGVTTSFTYDDYGRRLTIVDPSAGTETLTYDSKGNIASHKDASNKTTTFLYDAYYRLKTKQMPEYTINYTYDAKGNLNSINSNNGQSLINYTFDSYGRITAEAETLEGKKLTKQYIYSGDLLSANTYMIDNTTVTTENLFYQNGYHTETKLNGSKSIWKITAENERGQTTTALTGNFTRTYGFDNYGMPVLRKIQNGNTVIQNFAYKFDAPTGNLLSRTDNTRGITETFGYDNLNRLTNFGGSTASYAANGNIQVKNGISYCYETSNKPYAVSAITPGAAANQNLVPSASQVIEYTSFRRPASIKNDDILYKFTYNGLDERTKMLFSESKNKIYLNNCYEKDQNAGSTKEKLYLCGDYYTSHAVMVRENNGSWQLYYIGRDYLGSITHVTPESGSAGYEYSYDAWGNLRNPATQAVYAQNNQPDLFLGRGFTGHEHLSFCGLINMNARLYDPAVGRFLSPDPYVQSPDFTQSYNRYSYVWNNPLKYIDPTGEKRYTYNWWTGQYEDENGDWASWNEVKAWMDDNNLFKGKNDFTGGSGSWGVGESYNPGYIYFNPSTGQIRYLDPNFGGGALLKTMNAGGNLPSFMGYGLDQMDAWLNNVSNVSLSLGIGTLGLENAWRLISNADRQLIAYRIQQTAKIHGANIKTNPIKTNIGKGLNVAGKTLTGIGMATATASAVVDVIDGTHNTSTWVNFGINVIGGAIVLAGGPVVVAGAVFVWGVSQLVAGDDINGWIDDNFGYR